MKFIKQSDWNNYSDSEIPYQTRKYVDTLNHLLKTDPIVVNKLLHSYQDCDPVFVSEENESGYLRHMIVNIDLENPRLCAFGILAGLINDDSHRICMCFDDDSDPDKITSFGIMLM